MQLWQRLVVVVIQWPQLIDGAVTAVGCGCPVFAIGVVMLTPWQLTVAMQSSSRGL